MTKGGTTRSSSLESMFGHRNQDCSGCIPKLVNWRASMEAISLSTLRIQSTVILGLVVAAHTVTIIVGALSSRIIAKALCKINLTMS